MTTFRDEPAVSSVYVVMVSIEHWSYLRRYASLEEKWSEDCRWYRHVSHEASSNRATTRAYIVHTLMPWSEFFSKMKSLFESYEADFTILKIDVLEVGGNTVISSFIKKEILGT